MSPVNIKRTTTNKGRYYEWRAEDGKFWSVTTIVNGGLPKPVLVNWAKKYVATYAVENIGKLNALLDPGDTGYVDTEGAIGWLKESPYRDRDRRGALGTLVHDAAEAYILGKPFPDWTPEMRPRMEQFVKFLEEWQPDYMDGMVEAPVYNRAERYACTLDGICHLPPQGDRAHSRRVLIDYKTGKGIYPEASLQLVAYRRAEFIGAPDGSEIPMPEVDATVVLHIPDEGEYQLIEVRTDEEVWNAFRFVREVFKFMEVTSKSVLLGPFPATLEAAGMADPEPLFETAPVSGPGPLPESY